MRDMLRRLDKEMKDESRNREKKVDFFLKNQMKTDLTREQILNGHFSIQLNKTRILLDERKSMLMTVSNWKKQENREIMIEEKLCTSLACQELSALEIIEGTFVTE